MAFNPSPKVAAARDYGRKFSKDMVVIVSTDGRAPPTLEVVSYGETRELCAAAQELGRVAYEAVELRIAEAAEQV